MKKCKNCNREYDSKIGYKILCPKCYMKFIRRERNRIKAIKILLEINKLEKIVFNKKTATFYSGGTQYEIPENIIGTFRLKY